MVDYALSVSRQDKLYYVGHSQGTAMGFAGFSFNKTLASKIIEFYALAPVAFAQHVKGAFEWIKEVFEPLEVLVGVCWGYMYLFLTIGHSEFDWYGGVPP